MPLCRSTYHIQWTQHYVLTLQTADMFCLVDRACASYAIGTLERIPLQSVRDFLRVFNFCQWAFRARAIPLIIVSRTEENNTRNSHASSEDLYSFAYHNTSNRLPLCVWLLRCLMMFFIICSVFVHFLSGCCLFRCYSRLCKYLSHMFGFLHLPERLQNTQIQSSNPTFPM